MTSYPFQMKRWFVTIVDSGPLMRRSTCITWKYARFRRRERRLTPGSPKPEQIPSSGYWSRISKIARAIITELGKNAERGDYHVYIAQPTRIHGVNAGESLND